MKINTPRMWFRQINAEWPWLKIVVLVVFVLLMGVGIEEVLRHGVAQPIKNGETQPSGTAVMEEAPNEADLKVETKDDKPSDEASSSESKPKESDNYTQAPVVPAEVHDYDTKGKKLIAITFDDGPSTTTTPRLLDILQQKGVKATFFVVGTRLGNGADILRREVSEGHEVGSHTLSHANLVKLNAGGIQEQVDGMDNLFQSILGTKPQIMRPPYGSVNQTVRSTVPQPMILWTIDPEDWKYRDVTTVRANSVKAAFDGAILLLHDIHSTTVDAVPGIIDDLRAQGYEFLTVSELAAERGVVLQQGVAYGSFRP